MRHFSIKNSEYNLKRDFQEISEYYRKGYLSHIGDKNEKKFKKHFKQCDCLNLLLKFNYDLSLVMRRIFENKKKLEINNRFYLTELKMIEQILINYEFLCFQNTSYRDTIKNSIAEIMCDFKKIMHMPFLVNANETSRIFFITIKILNCVFSEIYDFFFYKKKNPEPLDVKTKEIIEKSIDIFLNCFHKISQWLESNSKNDVTKDILLLSLDQSKKFIKLRIDQYQNFIDRFNIKNTMFYYLLTDLNLVDKKDPANKLMPVEYKENGAFFVKKLNTDFMNSVVLKEELIFIENQPKRSSIRIFVPGEYFQNLPDILDSMSTIHQLEHLDINYMVEEIRSLGEVKYININFDNLKRNEKSENAFLSLFLLIYVRKQEENIFYDSISKTNSKNFDRLHKLIFTFPEGKNAEIHFNFNRAVFVEKTLANSYQFFSKKRQVSSGDHGKVYKLSSNFLRIQCENSEIDRNYFSIGFEFKNEYRVLKSIFKEKSKEAKNEKIRETLWQMFYLSKNDPECIRFLSEMKNNQYHNIDEIKEFAYYLIALKNVELYYKNSVPMPLFNKRGKSYHYFMPYFSGKSLEYNLKLGNSLKKFKKIEFMNFLIEMAKEIKIFLEDFGSHNDLADRNLLYFKNSPVKKGRMFDLRLIDFDHAISKNVDSSLYDYYFSEFLRYRVPLKNYYLLDFSIPNSNREPAAFVRTVIKGIDINRYNNEIEPFQVISDNQENFIQATNALHEKFTKMIEEDECIGSIPALKELFLKMHDKDHTNRPSFNVILGELKKITQKLSKEESIEGEIRVQNSP